MNKPFPFLLDLPMPAFYLEKRKKEVAFIKSNMSAKRFRVETETSRRISALVEGHRELYVDQRTFAKPPFESVFVQFEGIEADNPIGVLVQSNECMVVTSLYGEAYWSRYKVIIEDAGLRLIDQRPEVPIGVDESTLKGAAIAWVAMTEVLFLLMHKPGVVRSTAVAAKQQVVKGKLRPYRAHTVLNIDLSPKEIQKRIVGNGSRGPNREHEVRGTWVHLRINRDCIHQWSRAEVKEGMPERWGCHCCKGIRVWRRDHVRGNHDLGNRFHTYNVRG